MIAVYKWKYIPVGMESVIGNDVFFNMYTAELLDERAKDIIKKIDDSELQSKYVINSKFDGTAINIDKLSTGCKTVLNIMYNLDKIFDVRECGDNALDVVYSLDKGNICCEYPLISFDMTEVEAIDKNGKRIISDYDELKRWWAGEN